MIPNEYRTASADFDAYLRAFREVSLIESRNVAYTITQGVFQVFRRRLEVAEALRFADALPPVLRAIFVSDWDVTEPKALFGERAEMAKEVQALRQAHNFAPDSAIDDVAQAMRQSVDADRFARVLGGLAPEARAFWGIG